MRGHNRNSIVCEKLFLWGKRSFFIIFMVNSSTKATTTITYTSNLSHIKDTMARGIFSWRPTSLSLYCIRHRFNNSTIQQFIFFNHLTIFNIVERFYSQKNFIEERKKDHFDLFIY